MCWDVYFMTFVVGTVNVHCSVVDMSYKTLLIEWGLTNFVEGFEDEGIDDESFMLLDEETIRNIFVKSGPRLKFSQYYKAYLAKQSPPGPSNETLSVASSDTIESTSNYSYSFGEYDLVLATENSIDQERPNCVTSNTRPSQENTNLNKKLKLDTVFTEGLQTLLEKSTEGQIVWLNKQKLNNDHRQKLTNIIIRELTAIYGIDIKGSTFVKAAEEIVQIFPCEEKDTYYIRSNEGGPKGKLWYRYINVRAALKVANTYKKVETKPPSPIRDEDQSYLDFLKVATEPFPKILEFWEATYKIRRRLYMNASLEDIFNTFPCLKLDTGIELIETDFHKKFPDKIDIIYSTLPKIVSAIIKEVDERKIKINNLERADDVLRAFLTLPYLFPPTTLRKSRKGASWRPTRTEIVESFFASFENYDEIDARHQLRKVKLESHGLTLQPYIAVVGQISAPEFYLVVDDFVRYNVKGAARVLEVSFKLYHALDVEYPPECEHIWLLFEEVLFKMKPKKKNPCTASVLSDLNFHLNC